MQSGGSTCEASEAGVASEAGCASEASCASGSTETCQFSQMPRSDFLQRLGHHETRTLAGMSW